ncbi:hypothetical protein ACJ72_00446 [Emergomyces africanus]|uniref:Uncharacterized protein n=1 Tax=Emergomyces africanus TaxID=1955775 RepID=A0A1B7P870_9EURO|nr:hypothetical protein ACJ72_00446 [Emergomyces africanus]
MLMITAIDNLAMPSFLEPRSTTPLRIAQWPMSRQDPTGLITRIWNGGRVGAEDAQNAPRVLNAAEGVLVAR